MHTNVICCFSTNRTTADDNNIRAWIDFTRKNICCCYNIFLVNACDRWQGWTTTCCYEHDIRFFFVNNIFRKRRLKTHFDAKLTQCTRLPCHQTGKISFSWRDRC